MNLSGLACTVRTAAELHPCIQFNSAWLIIAGMETAKVYIYIAGYVISFNRNSSLFPVNNA